MTTSSATLHGAHESPLMPPIGGQRSVYSVASDVDNPQYRDGLLWAMRKLSNKSRAADQNAHNEHAVVPLVVQLESIAEHG